MEWNGEEIVLGLLRVKARAVNTALFLYSGCYMLAYTYGYVLSIKWRENQGLADHARILFEIHVSCLI